MVKIDLKELAQYIVENSTFSIGTEAIHNTTDYVSDLIDEYVYEKLEDSEQLEDLSMETLCSDLDPYIDLEIYNRTKSIIEKLDKEDREILTNNLKDYETYKE